MKYFDWSEEKNQTLRDMRNIAFEEVVLAIDNGALLDVLKHPDTINYFNQSLLIVEIKNYAYIVPFVEDDKCFFLKTIYPSRKATKEYLKKDV